MATEKYNALLATLEMGSMSAAAEKLGFTPSGMSRMVASMEEEMGFPLLIRSRNGVAATKECEKMLPYFENLLVQEEKCRQMAAEISGVEVGTVNIGTAYYYYYENLARLISAFGEIYPGINITMHEGISSDLAQMHDERNLDFSIISHRDGSHRWIPLKEDELVVWVRKDHPQAANGKFPIELLETENYIEMFPGKESDSSRFLAQRGIKANTRYSTYDSYAAYAMVEAGLGVAVMNSIIIDIWNGDVVALPLDPPHYITLGIAMPPEEETSPAVARFIKFALDNIDLLEINR